MTKVLLLPLVPKGGSKGPNRRKPLSQRNFEMKFAPYMYAPQKIIATNNLKSCSVSKWRPNNRFFISRHFDFGQNLKNRFPKRIFQWNLAQSRRTWIDLHYWNNISNKIIPFQNGGQNKFLILCNNSNLC